MKTAARFCVTALTAMLGIGFGLGANAYAQDEGPITSRVPSFAAPTKTTSSPAASKAASIEIDDVAIDSNKNDKTAKMAGGKGASKKGKLASPEVPDSVRDVITRLNNTTDEVTLEDLNKAREAVVKLDVLIDIEKRLTDLNKIRSERQPKIPAGLAAAIPSSALGLPSGAPGVPSPSPSPSAAAASAALIAAADRAAGVTPETTAAAASFSAGASNSSFLSSLDGLSPEQQATATANILKARKQARKIEVIRISGATGSYIAKVKLGSGKEQNVRKGEKLSDGSQVVAISREGVTFLRNKKRETIQVKDVTRVFNGG